MSNREWQIYALTDPRTNEWRYVGFTCHFRNRYNAHLNSARFKDTPRACWIWALLEAGLKPDHEFLESGISTRAAAGSAEQRWIAYLRAEGIKLFNSTDGGEGVQGLSAIGREKLRHSKIGKLLSLEARARMSAAARHRPPISEESRRKRSISSSRVARKPENIARSIAKIRGVKLSPEARAIIAAKNRGKTRSPEAIAKYQATRAAWTAEIREIVRQRQSAGIRASVRPSRKGIPRVLSPAHLDAIRKANQRPISKETRAKMSASAKARRDRENQSTKVSS
jgi:hypothetical protein